jgi:hypothetical protein
MVKLRPDNHVTKAIATMSGCLILAVSASPPSFAQSVELSDANVIKREYCSFVTPWLNGDCKYTVTTDGGGNGLNLHFDLSEVGDKGITWRVSRVLSTKKDYALLSTDLVVTRFPEVKFYKVQGTCSVMPAAFKCITVDGQFQSYATGIIR